MINLLLPANKSRNEFQPQPWRVFGVGLSGRDELRISGQSSACRVLGVSWAVWSVSICSGVYAGLSIHCHLSLQTDTQTGDLSQTLLSQSLGLVYIKWRSGTNSDSLFLSPSSSLSLLSSSSSGVNFKSASSKLLVEEWWVSVVAECWERQADKIIQIVWSCHPSVSLHSYQHSLPSLLQTGEMEQSYRFIELNCLPNYDRENSRCHFKLTLTFVSDLSV